MNKILFLDIETTGVDPEQHGIIEIAAKIFGEAREFNSFCRHEGPVDLEALKYNKAFKNTMTPKYEEKELLEEFCYHLLNLEEKKPFILCGQNIHFDFNFIKTRLKKYGVTGVESLISYRMLDIFTLSKTALDLGLIKTNNNSLSLNEVAKALGIEVQDNKLHQALYDVELSEKVYKGLLIIFGEQNGK